MPDGGKSAQQLFENALAATLRAISENKDLTVQFSANMADLNEDHAQLPHVPAKPNETEIAELRGLADSLALKARHHNDALHETLCPQGPLSQNIFNLIEQIRCETIGGQQMPGAAKNLQAFNAKRAQTQGLNKAEDHIEYEDILAATVGQIVRRHLTGDPYPDSLGGAFAKAEKKISKTIKPFLNDLKEQCHDQEASAKVINSFLYDLVGDKPEENPKKNEDENDTDNTDQNNDDNSMDGEDTTDEDSGEDGDDQSDSGDSSDDSQEGAISDVDMNKDDAELISKDGAIARRPNTHTDISDTTFYHAYTTQFDEVIRAEDLCDLEELDRLRKYLDQQMEHLQDTVSKLANRLQRRLMAQQRRRWNFDLEEGVLDGGRLARVVANPSNPLSYKQESDIEFRDTIVTLLIDNSGSMRGRPISIAAICADILARTLERCGVKVEILGFTTKTWKGGASRDQWIQDNRPEKPGRLNDLRHIIYKTADTPLRRARRNLGLMMREGLLKENIDGEALMWAHQRLIARAEDRRILMVISDGAPVDDSTQGVNSSVYLEQHLRQVIEWIEKRSPVELIAIGIGHDVTRYYKRAVTILDAEQLAGAMTEQLAGLFDETLPTPLLRGRR